MNAYQLYQAAFDQKIENIAKETPEYINQYALGVLNINLQAGVAEKILSCMSDFQNAVNADGQIGCHLDKFIKTPLEQIEISKDLNSYIVDDAGYCISTATYAASIAEVAQSVVNGLSAPEATEDEEDVFGELLTVNQQREQIALRLERMAQTATKLAAMLRSPQVDERNSEKIGYDAAHSVR